MPASNGGTPAPLNLALFPITNGLAGQMYTFDTTTFDDPLETSTYSYKVEDVMMGRTPTISRIIISYRDLGPATLFVVLKGTNDLQNVVLTSAAIPIGTVAESGAICTVIVGLSLTADNLQLTLTRNAGAGPVSITKVRMEGRFDTNRYA